MVTEKRFFRMGTSEMVVGSLTQTFFTSSLPRRAGGEGAGGGVNR